MASRRRERVQRLLRDVVSEVILHEVVDPRMGFVTVTRVETPPDLKTANVFVSIIGTESVVHRTYAGLEHASGFIHRCVAEKVELRSIPRLRFVLDDSVKKSVHIAELLRRAIGDDGDQSDTS